MKRWLGVALFLLSANFLHGQAVSAVPIAHDNNGNPTRTLITICTTNPGNGACPVLATTYTNIGVLTACTGTGTLLKNESNPTNGAGCSNPGYTDAGGNVQAFVATAGSYWCQFSGSTTSKYSLPCPSGGTGGGGTPGGTATQIQYNNAGAFGGIANSSVSAGGGIGLGGSITTPLLSLNNTAALTAFTQPIATFTSAGSTQLALLSLGSGQQSTFLGRHEDGTLGSPTAAAQGEILGAFAGSGYDGTSFDSGPGAFVVRAAENFTPTAHGTWVYLSSTPAGTTGLTNEQLLIDPSGNVEIGTPAPNSVTGVPSGTLYSEFDANGNLFPSSTAQITSNSTVFRTGAITNLPSPLGSDTGCPSADNPYSWTQDNAGNYEQQEAIDTSTSVHWNPYATRGFKVTCRPVLFNNSGHQSYITNTWNGSAAIYSSPQPTSVLPTSNITLQIQSDNPTPDTSTYHQWLGIYSEMDSQGAITLASAGGETGGSAVRGVFNDIHSGALSSPKIAGISGVAEQTAGTGTTTSCNGGVPCYMGIYGLAADTSAPSASDFAQFAAVAGEVNNTGSSTSRIGVDFFAMAPGAIGGGLTNRFPQANYAYWASSFGTNASDYDFYADGVNSAGTPAGFNSFTGPTSFGTAAHAASGLQVDILGATKVTGNFTVTGTCTGCGGGLAFPVTVTGGVSGAIPYASSTTNLAMSALLATNSPILGGGAGAAPFTASFLTTDGTTQLNIGPADTTNNGILGLKGKTSGTATLTAPAVAGTSTNPIAVSNVMFGPAGTAAAPTWGFAGRAYGVYDAGGALGFSGGNFLAANANGGDGWDFNAATTVGWCSTGGACGTGDTTLARSAAKTLNLGVGADATGTLKAANGTFTGTVSGALHATATNCSSSASPAVCAAAAAGSVALPTGTNPTLQVNTTAVTANSQIMLTVDESLGTKLSVTCNTTLSTLLNPVVTARSAGASFTFTIGAVIASNPACVSYSIIN